MSDPLIALLIAAGVSAFMYSRLGRRIGYGNSGNVWRMVGLVFVITFIVVLVLLEFVIDFH